MLQSIMPQQPSISILIPVYNVAEYLDACMDSILSQVASNTKIILMNDASTDHSKTVMEQYKQHPQVALLDAPANRGLSATRNALLNHADTDYVWFIDSDDAMYPYAYSHVASALQRNNVDVLCGDFSVWTCHNGKNRYKHKKGFIGKANHIYHNNKQQFLNNIIKNNSNHVWNKIYKKSVIEGIPFQVGKKFEDIYFMTDIADRIQTFAYCPHPLIAYRTRAGSIVNSLNKQYVDDYLGAFIHRVEKWEACQLDHDFKQSNDANYLFYKSFNRYVGLMTKLSKANESHLLKQTKERYHDFFDECYQNAYAQIDWIRRFKLNIKKRKLSQLLDNYY